MFVEQKAQVKIRKTQRWELKDKPRQEIKKIERINETKLSN